MSPVSRRRKPKKPAGRSARTVPVERPESALAVLRRTFGSTERPAWFDDSIGHVLDGAAALVGAAGPGELEQRTTELVGAQLHRATQDVRRDLRFGWFFAELADACRARLDAEAGGDGWRPSLWLLHGLAAIAPPALVPRLPSRGFVKSLRADLPPWLGAATRVAATGEVWRMRDAYGTRYAVIAEFRYPRDDARHHLLLDIDVSGFLVLVGVAIVDDVAQAAAAWRETVGDAAASASPEPVTDPEQLRCLVQIDPADETLLRGDESRSVIDNWFRTDRRIGVLHDALRRRRMPLPAPAKLHRDVDITVMTGPFTQWCAATGAARPDPESLDALAAEWMEGALPETWFSVSPARVEFQLGLIGDLFDEEFATELAALMPTWVRWLGERADLPEHLRERAVAAAAGGVRGA